MSNTYLRIFVARPSKNQYKDPIIMTDAQYDYIVDEIECRENFEFEWNVSVNCDEE